MPDSTPFPEDFIPFSRRVFDMVLTLPIPPQAGASLYVVVEGLSQLKRLDNEASLHRWRVEAALVALGLYSRGFPEVQAEIIEEIKRHSTGFDEDVLSSCFDLDANEERRDRIAKLRALPYADYLKSTHWERIRERAIARSLGRCQLCNALPTERASLHVHHRTYERVGAEYLEDLIALCEACHRLFHDRLPKSAEISWWDE
jgi:hypothetical protein